MHFIKPIYMIAPFEISRAAVLIAVTSMTGFAVGWTLALIWNFVFRDQNTKIPEHLYARP